MILSLQLPLLNTSTLSVSICTLVLLFVLPIVEFLHVIEKSSIFAWDIYPFFAMYLPPSIQPSELDWFCWVDIYMNWNKPTAYCSTATKPWAQIVLQVFPICFYRVPHVYSKHRWYLHNSSFWYFNKWDTWRAIQASKKYHPFWEWMIPISTEAHI